jgi:ligand-binding sensor domain-containing protein/serine phosphatase RsbU (regulator of sigma subunit)
MMQNGHLQQVSEKLHFILLIFIICLACPDNLLSQTYFFDNYSRTEGLGQTKVYCIVQDNLQFIWLGTKDGVSKFDGINFTNYTTENKLAPGGVRVLFIDSNNTMWLGHEGGGISRFNGKTFEKINLPDTLVRSNITSIIQDKDNQLWLTTAEDGALVIKNPMAAQNVLQCEHFLKGKSLGDQVFSSMAARDGTLYFITSAGIRTYNKEKNSFETYLPKGLFTYFQIAVMYEDRFGNLWFGTYNGGLYKQDHERNKYEYFDTRNGLASNWVSSITEDSKGNIWVGHWSLDKTGGGISRISPESRIKVFNTSNGLDDNQIWCITEDTEGNMLIGTNQHGLDIFKGEQFVSYSVKDGLIDNEVFAIMPDENGQLWIGTNEGISIYNNREDNKQFLNYNEAKNFISNQIRFFKQDSKNNIWIGTADQGVILYNKTQKRFVAQPDINRNLPDIFNNEVQAMEIGPEGHLWIGAIDRLVEYDINKNEYVATHLQGTGLAGSDITALYTDSKENLWIGSRGDGLTKMHKGHFSIIDKTNNITPTCITEDGEGKIWIGTESKGLIVLKADSLRYFGVTEGLLSNLINLLICDKENNIYVGTNLGLNKIDQHHNRVLTFTQRTGFTGIETKNNATCIDQYGNLWFGTVAGAIKCNPDLTEKSIEKPTVLITEMLVKGSTVEMTQGMKLKSNQNDISFRYISISLTNPGGVIYQIMLEGLHDSWQDVKNQNNILFSKLPPGRYIFRVRARNDYQEWTKIPVQFSFRVLPPFYKRGYFIAAIFLILITGFVTYVKLRERNLIQEKRILEERVKERTLALSKVNDELSGKNKDIMDSITYAKRIQFAILPPDIPFDNTFILFKPKDIVSGDFYWMNTAGGKEFLAAVDCTGHGVPGAFMSFIGFTSLNKIIIEQGIYEPASILNHLNQEVSTTLHQKGKDIVNDGMDIALVCYTPETGMLEYAGAFNPLIIIRKSEIIETKADRFAIGHAPGKENKFTNHQTRLEKEDVVYIFSDGFADQFGGPDEKKFKNANLKELLASVSHFPMDNQKELLDRAFEDWKGNQEQIDDVLVMGRKFAI